MCLHTKIDKMQCTYSSVSICTKFAFLLECAADEHYCPTVLLTKKMEALLAVRKK